MEGLSILFVLNSVGPPISIFILSLPRPLFGLIGLWKSFFFFLLLLFFFLFNLDRVSNVDLLNFQSDWWKHLLENIYHLERPFQPLPTFLVPAFRWKRAKMDTASARKPIEMKRLARLILVDYSNVVNSFVLLHPVMTN